MAQIIIDSLDKTKKFAKILANLLPNSMVSAIFLTGNLGSGKTTLISYLVNELPNGCDVEVSSPSFTICNYYNTIPKILHADLYRCSDIIPDEILEALDNKKIITIIEWANMLEISIKPEEYLDIVLTTCEKKRLITLNAYGVNAKSLLENILKMYE